MNSAQGIETRERYKPLGSNRWLKNVRNIIYVWCYKIRKKNHILICDLCINDMTAYKM